MFTKRLVRHIQSDPNLLGCFIDESTEAIIEELRRDEALLDMMIENYKSSRWSELRNGAVGSSPALSLKELERTSRKADEKFLVMCGWHDPDGGIQGHCAFCFVPLTIHEMTIDHLIPRSRGGAELLENLIPACPDCNRLKSDRSAEEYLASEGYSEQEVTDWRAETMQRIEFRNQSGNLWTTRLSMGQIGRLGI